MPTLDEALEAIQQAESLPSMPAVAVEVLRLTRDEDSTLDDLARTISMDPALAAKLLKLSNSSLYNLGAEVTTLQRATMVLGLKSVKLMSLSFSLASALPSEGQGSFGYDEYWRRSIVGAVAGRAIATLTNQPTSDEAFLCGLLLNVGQLVMASCLTEVYENVLSAAGESWPSVELENATVGFDSRTVAGVLLEAWSLPSLIRDGVTSCGDSENLGDDADPNAAALAKIMELVAHATEMLCTGEPGRDLDALRVKAAEYFDVGPSAVNECIAGLKAEIAETADMLSIDMPPVDPAIVFMQAAQQLARVSLEVDTTNRQLTADNRALLTRATTDSLTGLANRAAFDDEMNRLTSARMSGNVPQALGVLMIDVDKFKHFNDTFGHAAGDEVLRMVGAVLTSICRESDFPARYGGEEFCVVMPQTTTFGTKRLAERIRTAIETEAVEYEGQQLRVTISAGGACTNVVNDPNDGQALRKLADHYLYKAKENGRNRCEIYPKMQLPRR